MQAWPSRVASWIQPEMANNRVARGIVLVPCLLLGGALLATAVWGQGVAAENRPLATALGLGLLLAGVLAQSRVSDAPETPPDAADDSP